MIDGWTALMLGALTENIMSLMIFFVANVATIPTSFDRLCEDLQDIDESALQVVNSHDVKNDSFAEISKIPKPVVGSWTMDPVVGNLYELFDHDTSHIMCEILVDEISS